MQVKFAPNAPLFSVHTELLTADGNTCRVSVGNIFKAENLKAGRAGRQQVLRQKQQGHRARPDSGMMVGRHLSDALRTLLYCNTPAACMQKKAGRVQLSLPDPPEGWVLLSLDLKVRLCCSSRLCSMTSSPQISLTGTGRFASRAVSTDSSLAGAQLPMLTRTKHLHVASQAAVAAGGAGASPFKALKSIQLCSTITVRGAFSSDVRFSLKVSHSQEGPSLSGPHTSLQEAC